MHCLRVSIETHEGPNSFEYFRRLTASISSFIAKGADVFGIDRKAFLLAIRTFFETREKSDIQVTSEKLMNDLQQALGKTRKRWILQTKSLFEFSQFFSCAIIIAQAAANPTKELGFAAKFLGGWCLSQISPVFRAPRLSDLVGIIERLSFAVLKENDSKRYDPDFHYTFALWTLTDILKNSLN